MREVRASNPTRPVVIGGEFWSGIDSLATLPLPDDPYLVATFHYYEPFAFTHQGAPWITPLLPTGVQVVRFQAPEVGPVRFNGPLPGRRGQPDCGKRKGARAGRERGEREARKPERRRRGRQGRALQELSS